MAREFNRKPARAVVAAVQLPGVSDVEFDASLAELRQLAKTLGFEVVGTLTQKRASFDAAAYLGEGKREELRGLVEARADLVLIDHEISPSQAHNLEKALGCEGVSLFQANEPAGAQTVFHFHIHVLPRWEGDGMGLAWPVKNPSREALEAVAARLRAAL